LADCIDRGLDEVQVEQEKIREYVKDIEEVAATLEPGEETCADRQEKFEELIDRLQRTEDPIRLHMATVMVSFLAGLFVGEGKFEEIRDNLDLERWFRLPKSHERRIHGHRHAGVRIVQEGPTLVLALDAHAAHPGPFTAEELLLGPITEMESVSITRTAARWMAAWSVTWSPRTPTLLGTRQ
jgi:hypothetical protein